MEVNLILHPHQLETLKEDLLTSDLVTIDTETNVTPTLAHRFLVGIAVGTDESNYYIPVGHRGSLFCENYHGELPDDLFQNIEGPVIMHNAKFDLQVLKNFKIPTESLIDTMLVHHYIDEYPPHGLKELAKDRLGYEESKAARDAINRMTKSAGGYENIPVPAMAQYATQDTRMTYDLLVNLYPDWKSVHQDLWKSTDRPFLLLLKRMEEKGILVDRTLASQKSAELGKRLQVLMTDELGFDPAKGNVLADKLFSLPPYGLGLKPASYTPSGRPQINDKYLSSVGHPVTALVQEFRRAVKMKSAYYDAYLDLSDQDGRLYANFKQHGTLTGRLSCEEPNLHQIPRDVETKPIKKLFLPEENSQLWEFDFKGLEARLVALYSNSERMIEVFRNEGDIHQAVADQLGIPKQRHLAKIVVFLTIYGGGVEALMEQTGLSYRSAAAFLKTFRETFPEIQQAVGEATDTAEQNGWVRLWTDRHRHFKFPSEHHKAFNSIIQGGGFEIVKQALLNLDQAGYDVRNTVHDSAWVNIPNEDVNDALVEIPKIMSDWTVEAFGLRFSVDSKRLN